MTSPIDLTDAVQTAVFAALAAGVTLAPVFAVVPEGTLPPFVVIGDDAVDPGLGGKVGGRLERHEIRIVTVFAGASKRALTAAMHEVDVALTAPLAAAGAALSIPVPLPASDRLDEKTGALVGEQSFLIFAQPA